MHPNGPRQAWFYAIIALFLTFFLALGLRYQIARPGFEVFRTNHGQSQCTLLHLCAT
jgi:hypothetical protein